jgi:hypothetical protein
VREEFRPNSQEVALFLAMHSGEDGSERDSCTRVMAVNSAFMVERASVERFPHLDSPSVTSTVGSPSPSDVYCSRFFSPLVTSILDGSHRLLSHSPEHTFYGTISLGWSDDSAIVDDKSQFVIWCRALMMLPEAAR